MESKTKEAEAGEVEPEVNATSRIEDRKTEEETEGEFQGGAEFGISLKNILKTSFRITVKGSKRAGQEMMRMFAVLVGAAVTVAAITVIALLYILGQDKRS